MTHRCSECGKGFRKSAHLRRHFHHLHTSRQTRADRVTLHKRFYAAATETPQETRRDRIEQNMRATNPLFDWHMRILTSIMTEVMGDTRPRRPENPSATAIAAPYVVEMQRQPDGSFALWARP